MTHHGVLKRNEDDVKIRVVFNPTERDTQGSSLNDCLLAGPKLHQEISAVITRFRLRPVAVTCDIRQMFRCIIVHPDDRKYFHIFWRSNPNEPIREWEHTRVIFGATSSPFLANRTIQKLVEDEGRYYPKAALALSHQTFVDDILTGATSKTEALELKRQLISLLKAGGFELGKWSSSDQGIIQNLEGSLELPMGTIQSAVKVLGMFWETKKDVFQYKIQGINEPATKRGLLSRVARTYDINGYLSPFTFLLKSLIQRLWLLKLEWDDPLPNDIMGKWTAIKSELHLIESLAIPRCIYKTEISCATLIGFSDASNLGMAAVLYLRIKANGFYLVNLVSAKTKVAPLKSWTIPRLELGAACLLSKLLITTIEACKPLISLTDSICLVDSTTVLGWINTPPYKLKTFISNRVVQIQDNAPTARWRSPTTFYKSELAFHHDVLEIWEVSPLNT
ncbi:uncharacterized protein LOC116170598 [Photinus pyralis]|uniref:uncharacterized protein LOC116170598 n=1 Tax=Photinus pyralis TaxID=7054 RepID=UPI001266EFC3|nr:uncharacterized protein LOC116170598 [Photinus pyralis]